MVKARKRKKNIFDYEADWVPQKGRVFTMKASTKEEDQREDQRAQGDKIKTDARARTGPMRKETPTSRTTSCS